MRESVARGTAVPDVAALHPGYGTPSGLRGCPRQVALAKRFASSAARNSALALSTHSCCSDLGLESATMPAPACTYMVPSLISAVRSTMQLSSSPAAEK